MVRVRTINKALLTNPNHAQLRQDILKQNQALSFDSQPLKKSEEYGFVVSQDQVEAFVQACTTLSIPTTVIKQQKILALHHVPTHVKEEEVLQTLTTHLTGVTKVHLLPPKANRPSHRAVKVYLCPEAWANSNKEWVDIPRKKKQQRIHAIRTSSSTITNPSSTYVNILGVPPSSNPQQPTQQQGQHHSSQNAMDLEPPSQQQHQQQHKHQQNQQINVSLTQLKDMIQAHQQTLAKNAQFFRQKLSVIQENLTLKKF